MNGLHAALVTVHSEHLIQDQLTMMGLGVGFEESMEPTSG